MKINTKRLVKCIAIPLIIGGISALLTRGSMKVFETLEKPPLSPPGWLFPVAWTILYVLMGIASYLVLESEAEPEAVTNAIHIYFYQLVVNFLWPVFFFQFQWFFFSFIWLVLLILLVAAMIKEFYGISKTAAGLNIPYFLWILFAGYLNFTIWWIN